MLITSTSVVTFLLCVDHVVNGQPSLDQPSFNYCGINDLTLTCQQTGFIGSGFSWKKNGAPVYDGSGDKTGTGRFSQTSTANSFTLAISGAISDDGGAFVCNYAFQDSNSVTLQLYCPPTDNGTSVTRNDEKKLVIDISHIYPNTATVTVTKDTISLPGTTGTPTANGDYFDIQWISNVIIDGGLHAYKITVVTRTTTTVIDKEAIFGTTTTTTTSTSTTTTVATTTTTSTPTTTTTLTTTSTTTIPTTTPTTTTSSATMLTTTTPTTTTPTTTTTTPTTTRPTTTTSTSTETTTASSAPSTTTPSNARGESNTSLIAMIVVVSVIGGILVIAIVFMILVMVYWKSGLPFSAHRKGTHHTPTVDRHHHNHHRHHKHHKRNERSEHSFYQPQNVLAGYSFYRGGVDNPVFQESMDYPNTPVLYHKDANEMFHAPRYDEQPPEYQYAVNWEGLD